MRALQEYLTEMKGSAGLKVLLGNIAGGGLLTFGNVFWVDGDNGNDGNDGKTSAGATKTIAQAITNASAGDTILIKVRKNAAGDTDPVSYAEAVTIPATKPQLSIIGLDEGRAQGSQPSIKINTGSAAMITVRAPGCLIANLTINGINSTGGGILLDDDTSTKTAFGTTIYNCHFKNCVGSTATDASTGGAIQWAGNSSGGPWQVLIQNNSFYKNVGDIIFKAGGVNVQEVYIIDNIFNGPASAVDCNLWLSNGAANTGLVIRNNTFAGFPALASGAHDYYMNLTNWTGVMDFNRFASTGKTFGAAANSIVPTTVFISANWQESGLIART